MPCGLRQAFLVGWAGAAVGWGGGEVGWIGTAVAWTGGLVAAGTLVEAWIRVSPSCEIGVRGVAVLMK